MNETIKSYQYSTGTISTLPAVTICIPVRNGLTWLKQSIEEYKNQSYSGKWEILAIDSESNDGTAEFLKQFEFVRVIQIKLKDFNHGLTRNLAVRESMSPLILFTVQDAKPRNKEWLSEMVKSVIEYNLDGVCGGQAVEHRKDYNPLEWYFPNSLSENLPLIHNSSSYHKSSLPERMKMCKWDNVNAIYKRDTLLKIPFPGMSFGEDMAWAKKILETGGQIGYAKQHKVWHYHHHHYEYTKKRILSELLLRFELFGVMPEAGKTNSISKMALTILRRGIYSPADFIHWLRYNINKQQTIRKTKMFFCECIEEQNFDVLREEIGMESPMAPTPNLKNEPHY